MKYITDTTLKDINIITFIINVYDADMDETGEYKFIFRSSKTNYIIKIFYNGALQRVNSYKVEEFNKNYTFRTYIAGFIEACNIDDYDLSGIIL
jgi:hypothetical protein